MTIYLLILTQKTLLIKVRVVFTIDFISSKCSQLPVSCIAYIHTLPTPR